MKAQKKPIVIDYLEITKNTTIEEIKDWISSFNEKFNEHFDDNGDTLKVKTLEGTSYDVTTNDVIIRGVKGEYYPCKKDIFEQTYDKIN
jgi:hypothetical protein